MKLDTILACFMTLMEEIQIVRDMRVVNYAQMLVGLWTTEATHINGLPAALETLLVITMQYVQPGPMMAFDQLIHFVFKLLRPLQQQQPQLPRPQRLLQLLQPPQPPQLPPPQQL